MSVTMQDVAKRAGLSLATVSRVLNNQGGHYAEATRQQVLEAVAEMGYRVNTGAQAMRRGRFGCVAMVLSSTGRDRSHLPEEMIWGATTALDQRGIHLTVACLTDEQLTSPAFIPKFLHAWTADGLLVNYNKLIPARLVNLIESYRIPAIWLNHRREHDSVYPDDYMAGRSATARLLERGHRRITYISFSYKREDGHYSELDRREGYVNAMREAGLTAHVIDRYSYSPNPGFDRITKLIELLQAPDRPTALISYGGSTNIDLAIAAERLGLSIPNDLSVVTFSESRAYAGRQMDTFLVPAAEVARMGAETLLKKLETPAESLPAVAIPFGFAEGATVAPARP